MKFFQLIFVLLTLVLAANCAHKSKNNSGQRNPSSTEATDADSGLLFPFADGSEVDYMKCFGLSHWAVDKVTGESIESHTGIDIIPHYNPENTEPKYIPIVATANGKVYLRISHRNRRGIMVSIILEINPYWYIVYSFEPQRNDERIVKEQENNVFVKEGDVVTKGQIIGNLLASKPNFQAYPHVHYGFFYKNPNDTFEDLMRNQSENNKRSKDGTYLAPRSGQGSPWEPEDLGILTTLFCPLEYSNTEARAVFNSHKAYPSKSHDECASVCAYGSQNGDCGNAGIRK